MNAGNEFVSVRKLCAEIISKPTFLIHHFIEKFNQSIKKRMYRWMDTNKTERYIESLESLLEGYNSSNP